VIEHICQTLLTHPLWAQVNRYRAMGSRFRTSANSDWTTTIGWLVAFAIVAGVIVAIVVSRLRQREGVPFHNPRRLFNDLCRLHDLDRTQRHLLRQLASMHSVKNPAELFIEPAYFQNIANDSKLAAQRDQFEQLRQRLFDGGTAS